MDLGLVVAVGDERRRIESELRGDFDDGLHGPETTPPSAPKDSPLACFRLHRLFLPAADFLEMSLRMLLLQILRDLATSTNRWCVQSAQDPSLTRKTRPRRCSSPAPGLSAVQQWAMDMQVVESCVMLEACVALLPPTRPQATPAR